MKKISELDRDDRSAIVSALSNDGYDMKEIGYFMFNGEWKYCDNDEELKEAIKETFDEEFDNEEDFNDFLMY